MRRASVAGSTALFAVACSASGLSGMYSTSPGSGYGFVLEGGTYLVTWTATADDSECVHVADLVSVTGFPWYADTSLFPEAGETASVTTYAYGVGSGDYYVRVTSTCSWTVTIAPAP